LSTNRHSKRVKVLYRLLYGTLMCILISCKTASLQYAIDSSVELAPDTNSVHQPSFATIDVEFNLKPYFTSINNQVPKQFDRSEWKCEGVSYQIHAERADILFMGKGKQLSYSTDLLYNLRVNYCPKCTYLLDEKGSCLSPRIKGNCGIDEPLRKAKIGFSSSVKLLSDYRLVSSTKLLDLSVIDPCEITVVDMDITPQLKKEVEAEMQSVIHLIDSQVQLIPIREIANSAWNQLSSPIPIPSYGSLFLYPTSLAIGEYNLANSSINFPLQLALQPYFTTHPEPHKQQLLPNSSPINARKGVDLTLELNLGYDSLTSFINQEISGYTFDAKQKTIRIDSLQILPFSSDQMTLNVFYSGDEKGKLELRGKPIYHKEDQQLKFIDISYNLKSKNPLLKTGSVLFKERVTEELKHVLHFDMKPFIADFKNEIESSLNQEIEKDIHLKGTVRKLDVISFGMKPSSIQLFIKLDGDLKLIL
jgi:hypothetical protein